MLDFGHISYINYSAFGYFNGNTGKTIGNPSYYSLDFLPNNVYKDRWYNFVFVSENNQVKGYLNGINLYIPSDGQKDENSAVFDNPTEFYLGGRPWSNEYLNGSIDDVKFWNRALSSAEIKALYESNS